ncbi:MAG: PKD domain-containing protein [Candidatus Woesebacteria bacterium]|jgi:PKD repeat protein
MPKSFNSKNFVKSFKKDFLRYSKKYRTPIRSLSAIFLLLPLVLGMIAVVNLVQKRQELRKMAQVVPTATPPPIPTSPTPRPTAGSASPSPTQEPSPSVSPTAGSATPTVRPTAPGGTPPPIENRPPVAVAIANPTSGAAPLAVNFNGAGSHDPDDDRITFAWDFDNGTILYRQNANITFAEAGVYNVTLTVTDPDGESDTDTVRITVSGITPPAGNQAPVVQISASPTSGSAPLTVQFSSDGSYDPDGDDITYLWHYDDGLENTVQNPDHTYRGSGTYNVTLTVTDEWGAETTAAVQITVGEEVDCDYLTADFTGDRVVNQDDYAFLVARFFSNDPAADISGPNGEADATVNIWDYSALVNQWGQSCISPTYTPPP